MITFEKQITIVPIRDLANDVEVLPTGFVARIDSAGKTLFTLNITAHAALLALEHGCDLESLRHHMSVQLDRLVPDAVALKAARDLAEVGLVRLSVDTPAPIASPDLCELEMFANTSGYPIPAAFSMEVLQVGPLPDPEQESVPRPSKNVLA
jgi:hypothetical protein